MTLQEKTLRGNDSTKNCPWHLPNSFSLQTTFTEYLYYYPVVNSDTLIHTTNDTLFFSLFFFTVPIKTYTWHTSICWVDKDAKNLGQKTAVLFVQPCDTLPCDIKSADPDRDSYTVYLVGNSVDLVTDLPDETPIAPDFSLAYPNPVETTLHILEPSDIYDVHGKLLRAQIEGEMDFSTFPSGLYLVKSRNKQSTILKR